jgi:hypothetical protein
MKRFALAAFVFGLVGTVGFAGGQGKDDPTGTWKWETKRKGKDGNEVSTTTTLKLELKDGKLTGTLSAPGFGGKGGGKATESKIEDGKVDKGEVTFTVTREFNDMKFVTKYSAKVDGDTMKGTATSDFGGKEISREFEAKRVKEEKKD